MLADYDKIVVTIPCLFDDLRDRITHAYLDVIDDVGLTFVVSQGGLTEFIHLVLDGRITSFAADKEFPYLFQIPCFYLFPQILIDVTDQEILKFRGLDHMKHREIGSLVTGDTRGIGEGGPTGLGKIRRIEYFLVFDSWDLHLLVWPLFW